MVIHNCAFSPENAEFQMDDDVLICSFFSLAIKETPTGDKAVRCTTIRPDVQVIGYHVLPRSEESFDKLYAVVSKASNLLDLIEGMKQLDFTNDIAKKLSDIFTALTNANT